MNDLEQLKKLGEQIEKQKLKNAVDLGWLVRLTERERRIVQNCRDYANGDPGGITGHATMIVVNKMANLLDEAGSK